jgi:hypothetical protein
LPNCAGDLHSLKPSRAPRPAVWDALGAFGWHPGNTRSRILLVTSKARVNAALKVVTEAGTAFSALR